MKYEQNNLFFITEVYDQYNYAKYVISQEFRFLYSLLYFYPKNSFGLNQVSIMIPMLLFLFFESPSFRNYHILCHSVNPLGRPDRWRDIDQLTQNYVKRVCHRYVISL